MCRMIRRRARYSILRSKPSSRAASRKASREWRPLGNSNASRDPFQYAEYGFSIVPEQGDLIYLLCRGLRTQRVAEFATSIGMSTIYFAAPVREMAGGKVIGSELVPAKVAAARHNLADAGLADYAEIREGDARQTLQDLGVRWTSSSSMDGRSVRDHH